MLQSYAVHLATWGQPALDVGQHLLRKSSVEVLERRFDSPDRTTLAEWSALLPQRNLAWPPWKPQNGWMTREERDLVGEEQAAALRNRMILEGWLRAQVQSRWVAKPRGDHLILDVVPGARWTVASATWHLADAGLGDLHPETVGLLPLGAPFSNNFLREVQSEFAQKAARRGHATFHSGLIVIQADTVTAAEHHQVHLVLVAKGRPINPEVDEKPETATTASKHPVTWQGKVTFHGLDDSGTQQAIGGLRPEVWRHVVDWRPGVLHGGNALTSSIQRLQRLSSVRHVAVEQSLRDEGDSLHMDVDVQVQHGAPYDLSLELDLVRNNVRYGPRIHLDLAALNARSRGGRRSVEVGFGYVAAEPFSSFGRDAWLNSAEWSLHWNAERLGTWPLPLKRFKAVSEPRTRFDVGVDREIWPEFTRTQVQSDVSYDLKTGRSNSGRVECVPLKVSYVNLTNRSIAFLEWLDEEASPLVAGRFINHLNVGSSMLWSQSWNNSRLSGSVSLQSSWGGWLGQTLAKRFTQDPEQFDPETGAWMVREGVPLVQHQRHLVQVHLVPKLKGPRQWNPHVRVQGGWAGVGANTVSLPLEHSFLSGGANGIRGWRLRELGPGNLNPSDANLVVNGLGDVQFMASLEWRSSWNSPWDLAWFVDAGNVWLRGDNAPSVTTWDETRWESVAVGSGVGVRYDFEVVVLRLDAGLRVHDPVQVAGKRWLGQRPGRGALHLGVGMPF